MINYTALKKLCDVIPPGPFQSRREIWMKQLKLDEGTPFPEVMWRAVRATIGNFNFWEGDNEDVTWPENIGGAEWFKVATGERSLEGFNLKELRQKYLERGGAFIRKYALWSKFLTDPSWWTKLTEVYGNDPLRKRETLLAIVLHDLGYDVLWPMQGCIDYNVIVTLRSNGIVTGWLGNQFTLEEETFLRMECLLAIMTILKERPDLNPSIVDEILYSEGKRIRRMDRDWERFMCYRPGCYFY